MKFFSMNKLVKTSWGMKRLWLCAVLFMLQSAVFTLMAQEFIVNPEI